MEPFIHEKPIYIQIMDRIKKDIVSKTLIEGSQIASVRELALLYQVNPNTVQRALSECEREGYLKSDRTNGRFVSANEIMVEELKNKLLTQWVNELVSQCQSIGLDEQSICELIKDTYKKEGKHQ